MFVQGAKKYQTFIYNEKKVELPDLVKEIIVFHIRDKIWANEAEAKAFCGQIADNMSSARTAKERDGCVLWENYQKLHSEKEFKVY